MSLPKASKRYNVPKSTLHDHVTGRVKEGAINGKTPVPTAEEEKQLLSSATERAEMGVGFSKRNFLRAAGALAKKSGVSFKNGAPSEKRWTLFRKRNGVNAHCDSHNPTSNDDETSHGQVLFCFKRRSDYKPTGQQINKHLEYGRRFVLLHILPNPHLL